MDKGKLHKLRKEGSAPQSHSLIALNKEMLMASRTGIDLIDLSADRNLTVI